MGSGKGGGGADTSAIVAATNRGIDLQERIYDESLDRGEPYYNVGTAGLGKLADYIGISGGSQQSQEQIRQELQPQFTSESGSSSIGDLYRSPDGTIVSGDSIWDSVTGGIIRAPAPDDISGVATTHGYEQVLGVGGGGQTDFDGLNAAIDARLASQQETPEYFGSLLETFGADKFEEDPSYAFRQDEGQKAVERAMAARGKTMTPEALKAMDRFSQGLASTEYQNAYNRYNNDQTNIFNRLAAVSGIGQTANAQQAQLGQQYGASVSDLLGQQANAITAAQQADASRSSLFDGLLSAGQTGASLYTAFSDERLKQDVKYIEMVDGVPVYEFAYKIDPETRYRGTMAQDIMESHPDAVAVGESGFFMVDYRKLPIEMEVL